MAEVFEFTLIFKLPDNAAAPESHLDALYEAGCDDALVGSGRDGYIALDFDRQAADAAFASAMDAVRRAIPGVELVEAKPDLVGASEVAEMAGCSRQNVRLHLTNKDNVPPPAYNGATVLWHLAELAPFLEQNTPLRLKGKHIGMAKTTMRINMDVQNRRLAKLKHA